MTVEESVEIAKPPEVVWTLVRDLRRAPEWQVSLESVDVAAGTEVRRFARRRQGATFVVVEDDPPRRLVITSEGGRVYARASIELEQSGDGTRVDLTLDVDLHGPARFARCVVRGAVQRETNATLRRLKELAEA